MSVTRFFRQHPAFVSFFLVVIAAAAGVDGWIVFKRVRYSQEIKRLRAGMSEFERRQADAVVSTQQQKLEAEMELLRRQARVEKDIHLSISIDSATMYLEREGAVLRTFPIMVGPERRVGTPPDTMHIAAPRGTRTVERIVGRGEKWEVPRWVYGDRAIPLDSGSVAGALGPVAIILNGGTIIYTLPASGPLADSSYVLPGAVRASADDLRAILADIKRGTRVYFF